MSSSSYYVEIVSYEDAKVARRMECGTLRKAEKIKRGAEINLDHERYYVSIVEPTTASAKEVTP